MAKITRQEARDILFGLLFETEFHGGENPAAVYERACQDRDIPADSYVRESFFGVVSRSEILDVIISKCAIGWKAERLSRVSRTVIRIAAYEMLFVDDIPMNVSISQAVSLATKYGEDKAKQFVNGVLAGLFKEIESKGVEAVLEAAQSEIDAKAEAAEAEELESVDGEAEDTNENV